jgi:hypothetical protein
MGLAATVLTVFVSLLVLAWGLGRAVSDPQGTDFLTRWFLGLWDNLVVDRTRAALAWSYIAFLVTGVGYAYFYASAVAPVLYRAEALAALPWLCGALYALLPWSITLFLTLPLAGGGVLGSALAAGGFPWLALAAHLLHGVLVGAWTETR